jgi:(1->4)-alpha-D-glucan 1-alpha-D-glucosylmutase
MRTKTSAVLDEATSLGQCLDELSASKSASVPLSTYRLQFNKEFQFRDAHRLVPYLHRLGVSHCYASPILKARVGSAHGYDIIDHNQFNPEIGTEEEFRALVEELKARGMRVILDTVPNHMGIGPGSNPWWHDVLQNGRASAYADFFDIDWEPLKEELRNKVLIPILGDTYGEELEKGNIRLGFDAGQFFVSYFDNVAPIDPRTIPLIFDELHSVDVRPPLLANAVEEFRQLLDEFRQLPPTSSTGAEAALRRQREVPRLSQRLAELSRQPAIKALIERAVSSLNGRPGDPASFDQLHRLLEVQPYRLAFWRVSAEEINYRRFFDINDLVGLRMEDPRVFAETHHLIRRLLGQGLVHGLRIDHTDGLFNPVQYFARLQMLYAAAHCCGSEPTARTPNNGIELELQHALAERGDGHLAPLYLLVEKILERGEELPPWPVDGTVGYDFANLVNGVLIDRRNERHFTTLYQRVIGGPVDAESIIYQSKKLIMLSALSSEVNVLSHLLDRISMDDRRARDFTRSVLRNVIRETIACFPVYRTYIDERGAISERDRHYIEVAVELAKRRNPEIASALDFLRSILLLSGTDSGGSIYGYQRQLYFALKFQQLTGPVMAKGLEDTTCYVYNRFTSVNEVGGSPADFGISLDEFHRGNELRARNWPHSMLATSTHDTKRSEDVRARLDVLSEIPRLWSANVLKWRRVNRLRKVELADGRLVPDNNEEFLLYQTIVGAMPVQLHSKHEFSDFIQRIQRYMEKAVHEAKVNLSWLNPNPDYIAAMNNFIETILSPELRGKPNLFFESLQKFMPAVKYFGAMNALTQAFLKFTSPGVPDVYQGQELWDFSLVDPDNRRPVDFALRARCLEELEQQRRWTDQRNFLQTLLRDWQSGQIKLWLTQTLLSLRQQHRLLFGEGNYVPLFASGSREGHVIAFARESADHVAVVAAPRFTYTLMKGAMEPPVGHVWGDTLLQLGPNLVGRELRNVFTGETVAVSNGRGLLCRELFGNFPLALLTG